VWHDNNNARHSESVPGSDRVVRRKIQQRGEVYRRANRGDGYTESLRIGDWWQKLVTKGSPLKPVRHMMGPRGVSTRLPVKDEEKKKKADEGWVGASLLVCNRAQALSEA